MTYDVAHLGFPFWLRLSHYINLLFLTLLIRSGIQILSDHPRLYWNENCAPGSEWLKFIQGKEKRSLRLASNALGLTRKSSSCTRS
jgi:methionine sulfoxide reductase catalytic subunit